ncbi:hypothetical protein BDV95DRAFT_500206 [Massariosphaeria phaeospora]|uniref:Uncharacterized protein n=1 Tax=Massariosphaeria phaeospora TaxID=100035 RepID=A0A7C8MGI0_9PLEO|nr:hypothetical protein BDV95DRAFT_500206 [Massariosphaeria phaeospora]
MAELTVGYVAGLVALGIFVAQFWGPTQLNYILAGTLQDKETAATWTVAARALQSSFWPEVLRTDVVRSSGVRRPVLLTTYIGPTVAVLCAIAGIVTPLGLYDALEPSSGRRNVSFAYIKDGSPFGVATQPRSNLPFSRTCSQGHGIGIQGPAPCPYSDNTVVLSWNGSTYTYDMPNGYNTTVPNIVREIYSSGTHNTKSTVSNYFDIEWRRYVLWSDNHKQNRSTIMVSAYRSISSHVTEDTQIAVEGLVLDYKNAGIGFRNHTLPVGLKHGAAWTEDLMFIEPHSSCVNTNLSIEFSINGTLSQGASRFTDIYLVDNGGFFELNTTYPFYDRANGQENPDIQARAYKAAYLNNAWSMGFFNVTSIGNETTGQRPFSYMNSAAGKKFALMGQGINYESMLLSRGFGNYISEFESMGEFTNPFNVSAKDFETIPIVCAGATAIDLANSSNIYASCGLLRGAPRRLDEGTSHFFEGGSKWASPLYSCASAVRATIKTVSFLVNGTSGLDSLYVTEIAQKNYTDKESMPLWGFEETGLTNDGVSPVWGLVDAAYESYPNISLFRKPSLYLPGFSAHGRAGLGGLTLTSGGYQYMPRSDFASVAMNTVYSLSTGSITTTTSLAVDYTGMTDMAIYLRWQNLSASADGAAQIINLIWTDLAANAVVGTKGALGAGNTEFNPADTKISVQPIVRKIKYRMAFAVPALVLLATLLALSTVALLACLRGQSSRSKMRVRLNQAATGRLATQALDPAKSIYTMPSKDWARSYGEVEVGLSDNGQVAVVKTGRTTMSGESTVQQVGPGIAPRRTW